MLVPASFSIPIHEASHYIGAKLLGHKVTEMKIFTPNASKTLGYVNHQYEKSWFSPFSNMLIGLAPLVGGALTVSLLTSVLVENLYYLFESSTVVTDQNLVSILHLHIKSVTGILFTHYDEPVFWLWCFLVGNISVFCIPSSTDFKGAAKGIVLTILIYVLLTAGLGDDNAMHEFMLKLATWFTPVLLISITIVGMTTLLLKIITRLVTER